tara:strand:+ start:557 stop:796 length:240 start_codon:yes stop_codon:yes gene_type:complete
MSCLTTLEILGIFLSVAIGMASGPVLAKFIHEAMLRRFASNRLRVENELLRQERNLALLGSSHARMKLLKKIQDRGDFE